MISPVDDRRFTASQDAVSSRMGDELALLDFRSNTYFTLNETGASVWSHLEVPQSVDSLCVHLSNSFEIDPEQCRPDVVSILGQLEAAGLVDVVDGQHK